MFDIKQDKKYIPLNMIGLSLYIEGSIEFMRAAEDSIITRYPVIFLKTGK
jgi:hypothetical protein